MTAAANWRVRLVRSFSAGVSGQIQVAGKWDDPSGLVRGQVRASAILSIKYSLGWQFLVGYVPLFLEINLNAVFTLGFAKTVQLVSAV